MNKRGEKPQTSTTLWIKSGTRETIRAIQDATGWNVATTVRMIAEDYLKRLKKVGGK